mmetsp:Transcript_15491/g.39997  ORF Transcript_15491/g.39997 Transcript_15491/m.39997 type:complete len:217 (+) Transcript_15491:994-1644(+)
MIRGTLVALLVPSAASLALPTRGPSLVVFDCDHTLWSRPRFRAGPPWTPIAAGLGGVSSCSGEVLELFGGSRRALVRLADGQVPIAIVSRTHRPHWVREWLEMLHIDQSRTIGSVLGAAPLVVIRDGSKVLHVRECAQRANVALESILFFDDNLSDVARVQELGVTAIHCPCGITDELFSHGLRTHAARTPSTFMTSDVPPSSQLQRRSKRRRHSQ